MSTAVPFLPARPVRPERCWSVSASRGSSTWTTRLSAGQIDAARGDVGGDADAGAAVAQRLQRVRCARSGYARPTARRRRSRARRRRGVEMADIVARGAEQHRGLGLVEAQQVDHGMLDVRRRDGDRLIGDVAMAAILADGRDAQRVALVALGERDDRLGHRRREQQRAARRRASRRGSASRSSRKPMSSISSASSSTATRERRQVERAAFEMVAQAPGRADDDMRAMAERAALLRRRPCRRRRSRCARRPWP